MGKKMACFSCQHYPVCVARCAISTFVVENSALLNFPENTQTALYQAVSNDCRYFIPEVQPDYETPEERFRDENYR